MIVGERERRSVDAATLRFEQSRREADQARLAAAVRPCDLQCLAGIELEVQVLEQQASAATQRHAFETQQRAHSASRSSACMSSSEKPKWWPISWMRMCDTICSRLCRVPCHSASIGRLYKV